MRQMQEDLRRESEREREVEEIDRQLHSTQGRERKHEIHLVEELLVCLSFLFFFFFILLFLLKTGPLSLDAKKGFIQLRRSLFQGE